MFIRLILSTLTIFFYGLISAQSQDIQLANEYYQQGELEKAKSIYDQLATQERNIAQINSNYIEVLKQIGQPKEIEKYLDQLIKWFPGNIAYRIDQAVYYHDIADVKTSEKLLSELAKQNAGNPFQLSVIGQQLANKRMYKSSADFFLQARASSKQSYSYALELARIYGLLNNKEKMVDEYLTYSQENQQNAAYIKNILQNLLNEEEDLSYLEHALISRMQKEPDDRTYPDLMIWLELQRQNYYGAYIQARALDKRERTSGNQTMRVGTIAMDNESWDDAITIFEYLTKTYNEMPSQAYYRKMLIEAREGKAKTTYPVNKNEIRNLSREYSTLYSEMGPNNSTFEALRNLAHLHAFYLGEIDTAAIVLNHLINTPRVSKTLVSQSKLDLGDIHVLRDQPWEATLLYSQVEKDNRDSPLAYDAKLRNARLHYFTGNFALAKSHLDILKRATTREISNDAIDLTILISDNTYLDSTDRIMQDYASIDLLIFQNQDHRARMALEKMLAQHPNHSIRDEVYWQLSKLHIKSGQFTEAINYLEKIIIEFGYDILSDDAAFKIAELTEQHLLDPQTAQELYQQFMIKYPASMYTAEARKRYRKLRGDFDS